MTPAPPRLTLQELQQLFLVGMANATEPPGDTAAESVKNTLREGLTFLDAKPQVFDFGRNPGMDVDHKMAAELWFRKLLRPPFPTCILTFIRGESRVTFLVIENATVDLELENGKPITDLTAMFIVSQFKEQPARVDAFSWFRCPSGEHVETGAVQLSNVEGETDESFKNFTLGCLSRVMGLCLLLNTKGIRQRHEPVPVKLNQKRARSGKPPLDAVTYVNLDGVSLSHSTQGSGHEKSMHLRRGHIRHYDDGSVTWVRDTIVKADGQLKERTRYQVR